MNTLFTLTAKRVKETKGAYKGLNKTEIYNASNQLIATFPANQTQPRKGSKKIHLGGVKYSLCWDQKITHEQIESAKKILEQAGFIMVFWTIEDVMYRAKDIKKKITRKQAMEIVGNISRTHDCNYGITWETLDYHINEL